MSAQQSSHSRVSPVASRTQLPLPPRRRRVQRARRGRTVLPSHESGRRAGTVDCGRSKDSETFLKNTQKFHCTQSLIKAFPRLCDPASWPGASSHNLQGRGEFTQPTRKNLFEVLCIVKFIHDAHAHKRWTLVLISIQARPRAGVLSLGSLVD